MNKIINPILDDGEIVFSKPSFEQELEDGVKRTISILYAYNRDTGKFILVSADENGSIGGGGGSSNSPTLVNSQVDVANTATLIASINAERENIFITNSGTGSLFIGYDSSVTIDNGMPIPMGDRISIPNYTGTIYGIVDGTTTDTRILEVV